MRLQENMFAGPSSNQTQRDTLLSALKKLPQVRTERSSETRIDSICSLLSAASFARPAEEVGSCHTLRHFIIRILVISELYSVLTTQKHLSWRKNAVVPPPPELNNNGGSLMEVADRDVSVRLRSVSMGVIHHLCFHHMLHVFFSVCGVSGQRYSASHRPGGCTSALFLEHTFFQTIPCSQNVF